MKKASWFIDRLASWLTGKKGLIATGILGGVMTLVTAFFFLFPYLVSQDPGSIAGNDFHSLREAVLEKGSESTYSSIGAAMRSAEPVTLEDPDKTVKLTVGRERISSDYFEFVTESTWSYGSEDYLMRSAVRSDLFMETSKTGTPFCIEVSVFDKNGEYLIVSGLDIRALVYGYFDMDVDCVPAFNQMFDRHGYFWDDDLPFCVEAMKVAANGAASSFRKNAELFGYPSGEKFVSDMARVFHSVKRIVQLSRVTVFVSVIAVVLNSVFFGSLVLSIAKRRENREKVLLFSPRLVEEKNEETNALPIKESRFEAFLSSHHIRPVLGEWFFRVIGLILVAVSSLFLTLFTQASIHEWGGNWQTLEQTTSEFFENASTVGSFLLLVIVIGIVSETRMNLHLTAWWFISLSAAYYFISCSSLFAFQMTEGRLGESLANLAAAELPGNIFLGIGLFSITGFFLFFNPPRSVINRRVFRFLSIIPISIAVLSVVFTYLYKAEIYTPSYWVRNILFIRDSCLVFMGIFYELSIFAFRSILKMRHGEESVDRLMERPYVQFQKNIMLCFVIAIFTAIFYLIPADQRSFFGFTSTHAFYFLTIPFFIFYKPSGRHYNSRDSIIYYAIYAVIFALPSLPGLIEAVSSR